MTATASSDSNGEGLQKRFDAVAGCVGCLGGGGSGATEITVGLSVCVWETRESYVVHVGDDVVAVIAVLVVYCGGVPCFESSDRNQRWCPAPHPTNSNKYVCLPFSCVPCESLHV